MEKVRYEIDPHNRLVIKETGRETELHRFRKVLDGKFNLGEENTLTYHVKAPLGQDEGIPHQVKLKGRWHLTEKHDFTYILDKWGRQTFGDQLTLDGKIIDVNKNSILFGLTTRTKDGDRSTYILKLEGSWQADKDNRLIFRINRERGKYDILTFSGIWTINDNHQIIYQYEKADLTRKRKRTHTLTFKGYWDIKETFRISYILDKNTDSAFNFRTSLGIFKEDYIKYEIGIGLSRKESPAKRRLILFGTWKIRKDKGLLFEVEYENDKVHAISFGADVRLTDRDTLLFKFKDEIGNKDFGAELEIAHKLLKGDGEAFLRFLQSSGREHAILAGATWRW